MGTERSNASTQRLTVRDTAVALGISEGAVRMRVKRGTLRSVREGGRLYVLLHTDPTPDPTRSDTDRLISTLEEQLRAEREHLRAEREAHAEARRLLAAALERIPPQLEAPTTPSEPRESPETPSEPRPSTPGPPESGGTLRRVAEGAGGGVLAQVAIWAAGITFVALAYLLNRVELSVVGGGALAVFALADAIHDIVVLRREFGWVSRWSYVQAGAALFVIAGTIYYAIAFGIFIPTK